MTWCEHFKEAIEEETIRVMELRKFDWDEDPDPIEKGFYIVDRYHEEEYGLRPNPAEPIVPLKFCPWCGATLTMEDI